MIFGVSKPLSPIPYSPITILEYRISNIEYLVPHPPLTMIHFPFSNIEYLISNIEYRM
jgi:hypothetical protein